MSPPKARDLTAESSQTQAHAARSRGFHQFYELLRKCQNAYRLQITLLNAPLRSQSRSFVEKSWLVALFPLVSTSRDSRKGIAIRQSTRNSFARYLGPLK